MSTNHALSLFSGFQYQTKKENTEKALRELGIIDPAGKHQIPAVKIEQLSVNEFDLFSFDFSTKAQAPKVEHEEERAVWTATEVATVHENLICEMLEDIRDKRIGDDRLEEWLCWVEGQEEIFGNPLPFSYEACCYILGFDPDEFRHRLTYVLRHHRGWNIRWHERVR